MSRDSCERCGELTYLRAHRPTRVEAVAHGTGRTSGADVLQRFPAVRNAQRRIPPTRTGSPLAMETVVSHTVEELREGLRCASRGELTPRFRAVEQDLRLAGFVTEIATVTPAGRRFLSGAPRRVAA